MKKLYFFPIFLFTILFLTFFCQQKASASSIPATYIYNCFCINPNPTPGADTFRPALNNVTDNQDPQGFCTAYCTSKSWTYIGYQKPGEDPVIIPDYKEKVQEQLEQSIDKKEEDIDNVDDTKACTCENGQKISPAIGKTCAQACNDQGSSESTQEKTQNGQGAPTPAQNCECANGNKDYRTDEPGCKSFCQAIGSTMKSFSPPATSPESNPSSKTSIDNPLKGINTPADLIKKIINYVLGFVGALAVLIIIYSGFVYMTSRGNEKQIESAKNTLTYAIVGLVVIFASIIIVNAVISAIGG